MNLKHEISVENLKVLEIKKIALNTGKFGALAFNRSFPLLDRLRKILVEFDELGFEGKLTQGEVDSVNSYKNSLIDYINRIESINPEMDASFNKNVRDNLENDIETFCNNTVRSLRGNLVYLRQEAEIGSHDKETLKELQKEAMQMKQEFEKLSGQMKEQLDNLLEKKKAID